MTEDNIPQFTSPEGVAKKLGIHKRTVLRLIKRVENPIPHIYLSDQTIRIPLDQLEIWINEQKMKGGEKDASNT